MTTRAKVIVKAAPSAIQEPRNVEGAPASEFTGEQVKRERTQDQCRYKGERCDTHHQLHRPPEELGERFLVVRRLHHEGCRDVQQKVVERDAYEPWDVEVRVRVGAELLDHD